MLINSMHYWQLPSAMLVYKIKKVWFFMKYKNLKIFGFVLSSALSMSCLSGCSGDSTYDPLVYQEETGGIMSKQFDVGEHYISVPMEEDISESIHQIKTYPGYEVVGASYGSYGELTDFYAGGTILYRNVSPVTCETNLYGENGEIPYLEFGTPIDYTENNVDVDSDIRDFNTGEHVLSVPIEADVTDYNHQYDYHDGYEIIGISVSAYGRTFSYYAGEVVLYKNTVPVRVSKTGDDYASFGVPIEKEKELKK